MTADSTGLSHATRRMIALMLSETQAAATTACRTQPMRQQAGTGMGMTNGNGQSVGGVDLRFGGELEHVHDHHLHLLFIGRTGANDRLLDLSRSVFGDLHALFGTRNDGGATGLAQLQGRVGVFSHEDLFNTHGHRAVGLDHFTHAAVNDLQALGQLASTGTDTARGDVDTASRGVLHHAKAGDSRTGVDT